MRTNTENQQVDLKKKIAEFFTLSSPFIEKGFCPTRDLLAHTLDKWSLFCLYNLGYYDVLRFNELKSKIESISSRMLSVTLKRLEENGMVSRKIYPEVPPRVEYALTAFGEQWSSKLIDLAMWFIEHHEKTQHTSENLNCKVISTPV